MRRAKKKEKKKIEQKALDSNESSSNEINENPIKNGIEVTAAPVVVPTADVVAPPPVDVEMPTTDDPAFSLYKDVFSRFGIARGENQIEEEANAGHKGEVFFDQDDNIASEDEEEGGEPRLSKKKRKALNKLSIAELKALVRKPEVVEWHDVSSSDPRLLVQIKAGRNVVPVPSHWSLKREYLSSKRGIEKPPFRLPQFISETGITEMRDAVLEKQEQQTLKQKQRERVNPKMGRLDIDYQRLYDAFFRFQTKPELTRYGEVYYEGKEWETDFRHFRPGELTDTMKEALSMPPGAPPPWLINQQRFGPPPSYPNLKIPGLNAPPPPGAQWGFHPGGYGKPPVDEFNRPLYGGDIFGIAPAAGDRDAAAAHAARQGGEPVVRTLWGELQPREEESDEEDESEEESDEEEGDEREIPAGGLQTPAGAATAASGFVSSIPTDLHGSGVETSMAGEFDLRKTAPRTRGVDTETSVHGVAPRQAYQVLQERAVRAEGFFGSDRVYDLNANASGSGFGGGHRILGRDDDRADEEASRKRKKPGDVDVSLDPDALARNDGLARDEVKRRYEEGRKEEGVGAQWRRAPYEDDLSEMIAQESRKRVKRDEERRKYKF